MESTKPRMIIVAVLVCFFATGMAGLLNYFKYRATADRLVKERMLVIGNSINSSIQLSAALGMQFNELKSLPDTMARERAADELVTSIEVFDPDGMVIYSTDRLRVGKPVPAAWIAAARKSGDRDWLVESDRDSAAGIVTKNSFGLTLGYVAVRFAADAVRQAHEKVAFELGGSALAVFAASAALASLALVAVMNRLTRDIGEVENVLRSPDPTRLPERVRKGPFGSALRRFFDTVRQADAQLLMLQGKLERGNGK